MDKVQEALAAVRANPNDDESPLPWRADDTFVFAADGTTAAHWVKHSRACHIAAAVNSAPVLAAEVERSHDNLLTQAKRAGLPVEQLQATDLAEHLADRVLELEAQLAAARVAVEAQGIHYHRQGCTLGACNCGADAANAARTEARRAVGLEESHG